MHLARGGVVLARSGRWQRALGRALARHPVVPGGQVLAAVARGWLALSRFGNRTVGVDAATLHCDRLPPCLDPWSRCHGAVARRSSRVVGASWLVGRRVPRRVHPARGRGPKKSRFGYNPQSRVFVRKVRAWWWAATNDMLHASVP